MQFMGSEGNQEAPGASIARIATPGVAGEPAYHVRTIFRKILTKSRSSTAQANNRARDLLFIDTRLARYSLLFFFSASDLVLPNSSSCQPSCCPSTSELSHRAYLVTAHGWRSLRMFTELSA